MAIPSGQPALFLRLPDELIAGIFKLCHVSDHFNLALTCRRLASGGDATLERHRAAYREYSVVTDWKHLTIPSVLQKVITDPYVAWNVRIIEIFGTRYSWEQWGDFMSEVPSTIEVFPSPGSEDTMSSTFAGGQTFHQFRWREVFEKPPWREFWPYEETDEDLPEEDMIYAVWRTKRKEQYQESVIGQYLTTYIDLLIEHGHFRRDDDEIEWLSEQLLKGNDGPLKALLITLCPRLSVLKHANSKDDTNSYPQLELMEWLSQIITRSWRRDSWAPGLKSLREVSVGIPTGLWFEDRNLSGLHRPRHFRSLMLLPRLKSVYFGTMNLQRDTLNSESEERPPQLASLTGFSSVEHIFLDQFVDRYDMSDQEYTAESVMEFLLVPKKLKSLTVRGGLKLQLSNVANNQALYVLMLHLSKSLERAIEYNCRLRPSESTWGWFGRTNPIRELYTGTTKITINAVSFMISGFPRLATRKEELDEWQDPRVPRSLRHRGGYHILPDAEVLLVQKSYRDDEIIDEEVMERLESQLYRLVENNARSGRKLKAIFIQQQPNPDKGYTIADFDYSRLINLGRERDIDIHVKENENVPFHQFDFPTPPTMPLLQQTSAEDGMGVFDPFMGYWTTG
ncbi:hypothetical protein FLAG1_02786 [Fusarium langsethiae]|uniref:F-box domain-containing protein n=1 Tax=Fusarium langsethiae TaxID=179993 RepID=A0A0M9F291_FUSLA|nr:hypothetical protein FLAG1_02786 [Fusarium langsethiae]